MKNSRLAALTIFALPLPVILALVTIHCHGAGFDTAGLADPIEPKEASSSAVAAGGQGITSLILSPATVRGGQPSSGTVSIRYPAPAGGLVISLQHQRLAGVSIPAQVIIPEGKLSATFAINSSPVNAPTALNVSAVYQNANGADALTILPRPKAQWFVSPTGSADGQGTQNSPWDLATALAQGPKHSEIRPGDTIWLRGGKYVGTFLSKLNGAETEPIIVRAMPGERAIIDKAAVNEDKQPALKIKGSWVWFWGIEITNSSPNRQRKSPYTGEDQPWRGSGADVYAPHVKFINMIFHDNGHGIWDKQNMTEVHGCLFFYNGNNKREHALYIGNAEGTKYITDNIIFSQGGYGILAHSDSSHSSQSGLHLEGNISFNNGAITGDDQKTGNLQVGGVEGVPAERIVIRNNYIYNNEANGATKNQGMKLGYEDESNRDIEILDNYIVSRTPLLLWWWQNVNFKGNTIYSTGGDLLDLKTSRASTSGYQWDFNNYFAGGPAEPVFSDDTQTLGFTRWRQVTSLDQHSVASKPTGVRVFLRPNRYEAGRANIVIFNWDSRDQVAVDASGLLTVGASFEIRDAQNYFGAPVLRGVYRGGPLMVPMKNTAITAPIGNVERTPRHTSAEFGVFVLQTISPRRAD